MSCSEEISSSSAGENADGYETDEESEFDEDEEDKKTEALREVLKNTSFVMPPPINGIEEDKNVAEQKSLCDEDGDEEEPDAIEASLVLQIVSSSEDGPANVKVN